MIIGKPAKKWKIISHECYLKIWRTISATFRTSNLMFFAIIKSPWMRGIDVKMFLLFDPVSPHLWSSPHIWSSPYVQLSPHVQSSPHIWLSHHLPNPIMQPSLITPRTLTKEFVQGNCPRNLSENPVLIFGQMEYICF